MRPRPTAVELERLAPLRLAPWMRRFFRSATRADVDLIAISMGRGAAKTTTSATLAAAWFQHQIRLGHDSDVVVLAASFEQAKTLGRLAGQLVPDMGDALRRRDSQQVFELEHRPTRARLRVVGADSGRAMGWRPSLILCDEPSYWGPRGSDLWAAALTSLGKFPDSRLVVLGTRPDSPDNWYQQILDRPGPRAEVIVYAGDPTADPADRREWHKANPSLRTLGIPSVAVLAREAAQAADSPEALARFRALRLNAGVSVTAAAGMLLEAAVWDSCPPPGERAGPLVLGLDIGGNVSLTGLAGYWPATGRLEALTGVGGIPSLAERGRHLGAPSVFVNAAALGELVVSPGRNANLDALLSEARRRWGRPEVLIADRWRQSELRDVLDRLGWAGEFQVVVRGRGVEQAEDVRRFRRRVNDGLVRPVRTELFDRSVASARLQSDPAGNWTFHSRANRPDDLAVAATWAVASADRAGIAPVDVQAAA